MPSKRPMQFAYAAVQAIGLIAVLAVTNVELPARVALLVTQGRYSTLLTTGFLWVIALLAILAVVTERNAIWRGLWAVALAAGGALAWGFQKAAGLELSVFDLLSFWEARHEAANATHIYGEAIKYGVLLFAASAFLFSLPYISRTISLQRFASLRRALPLLPVVMIAGVVFQKGGNGHFGMPKQFSQVALAGLAGSKILLHPDRAREKVSIAATEPKAARHILYLVDESLRPDFLSLAPGNAETPNVAAVTSGFVNYGPAASGGICSNYSNAILRFMASRDDIGGNIATNPTVWKYAKAAGYRTVYIDAQAHAIQNETRMQNFMNKVELEDIDAFYPLAEANARDADFGLLSIIETEMAKPGPVFIYANKQGMHFPYDQNYGPAHALHHPTETEAGRVDHLAMVNSYRNALHANVEVFFGEFAKRIALAELAMVYTSDHGQYFAPGELTHCKSSDGHPQMALVPLFAYAPKTEDMQALRKGAARSEGAANHFQIAPTLLDWMGYRADDIAKHYPESLTTGTTLKPAYTMGDVFGLFSSDVNWAEIDLRANYTEQFDKKLAGLKAKGDSEEVQQ